MAKHVISSENVKRRMEKPTTFIERGTEEPAAEPEEQKMLQEQDIKQEPQVGGRVRDLETFASEYGAFSIEASKHINTLTATVSDLNAQVTQLRSLIFQMNAEISRLTGDLIRTSTSNEEFHAAMAKALRETLEVLPTLIDSKIGEVLEIETVEEGEEQE